MFILPLGDPASTTVEILAKRLAAAPPIQIPGPKILVGSLWQWQDQIRRLEAKPLPLRQIRGLGEAPPDEWSFLDVGTADSQAPAETLAPIERGRLSLAALKAVPALDEAAAPLAVVTGPIDKNACRQAGFAFPGQTEFFENLWDAPGVMILAGPRLRVGLATNHLALADVPSHITREGIVGKLRSLHATLVSTLGIERPRLAVCALNPHAGDGGLFGTEDQEIVGPAIADANNFSELDVTGPLPADTVFYFAARGDFDAVLALYHDQGLGPLKTVHFDTAVNLTGGLPHLRVSPDHGPGRDLFLRGRASAASWNEALRLAAAHLRPTPSTRII